MVIDYTFLYLSTCSSCNNTTFLIVLYKFISWFLILILFKFRCFITKESYEDLNSTILGFDSLAKKRLSNHPGSRVVPSLMNSDVIENLFSSQRGRCHGANTNPSVLAYSKALNTIVMTTELQRSSKRNAGTDAAVGGAHPYNIMAKKTFRQQWAHIA